MKILKLHLKKCSPFILINDNFIYIDSNISNLSSNEQEHISKWLEHIDFNKTFEL